MTSEADKFKWKMGLANIQKARESLLDFGRSKYIKGTLGFPKSKKEREKKYCPQKTHTDTEVFT